MSSSTHKPQKNIILIGGGIQSASTAFYLSLHSPSSKLTILEANDKIAPHASGKGGGFLARDWGEGTSTDQLHKISYDLHATLAKQWNLKSYRKLSTVSLSPGTSNFSPSLSTIKTPNWLNGKGGSTHVMSDVNNGGETAQVTPREYVESAISHTKNLEVRLNSRVTNIVKEEAEGGEFEVTGVELSDGTILACDCVIVCSGPWACMAEEWFNVRVPMGGIKSSSLVYPPRDSTDGGGNRDDVAIFCEEDGRFDTHLELYPRPDGSLYVCGLGGSDHVPSSSLKSNEFLVSSTCTADKKGIDRAKKALSYMSKTYKNEDSDILEQACMRPCLSDGLPIISSVPNHKNCFINAGHNCWGILWTTGSGLALAEKIVYGDTSRCGVDLEAFRVERFGGGGKKGGGRGRKQGSVEVGEQW